MKKFIVLSIMFSFILVTTNVMANELDPHIKESRKMVKDFMGTLKLELKSAIRSGGPVNAIGVCNLKAQKITKAKSKQFKTDIGRTSLKLRNEKNKPDAWELKVLENFEARKKQGEKPQKMEFAEIVENGGQKYFRYMKAIPTGKPCMVCHGPIVSKPVAKRLKELYPHDKARGFRKGDIRGAFTITKKLP